MGRRKLRTILIFIGLVFNMLFYQNCTKQSGGVQNSEDINTIHSRANGTGYEGKVTTYGSRTFEKKCDDGSILFSSIEVSSSRNTAVMTRNECKDISPITLPVESLDILPHNLDNFVKDLRFYERYKGQLEDKNVFAYCRGQARDLGEGPVVVDIKIVKEKDDQFYARVLAGKYDAEGRLLEKDDSGLVQVRKWHTETSPDRVYFSHYNSLGEREWHIKIEPGYDTVGGLKYYIEHKHNWGSVWRFPCLRFH